MFGEMFADEGDQQEAAEAEALGGLPSYVQARAPHCAADIDMPPL